MKKLSILCSVPFLFAWPVEAALDFTLQHKVMQGDAITAERTYITDGNSRIYLQISGLWNVADSAQGLVLTSRDGDCSTHLESYKGPPISIDEVGGLALSKQLIPQVPAGSKNVQLLPTQYNPLPIFGWKDVEVTVTYEFFGQTFRRSLMYINMLPGRLVLFSVTAPDNSFDKSYKHAHSVLTSWFEPSRDLPPELARHYEDAERPTM